MDVVTQPMPQTWWQLSKSPKKKHARDKYIVTPTKLNAALAAIPTIALYIKYINIFPYK